MTNHLKIGTILYGFCNGYFFGKDEYADKRIEAFGADWIVARDIDGCLHFANFQSTGEMESLAKEWSIDHFHSATLTLLEELGNDT